MRINPGQDASLSLAGRFVLGGGSGEAGKNMDALVLTADKHKLGLRVVQLSSASDGQDSKAAAQADLLLPLGREVEGVPSMYFGGLLWVPLLHVAPENPCTRVVGRALLSLEVRRPSAAKELRLMRQLPLIPAGLYLPLYKDWEPPRAPTCTVPGPGVWPVESAVRALAGDDLWKRLSEAQVKPGVISSGAFQAAVQAAAEGSSSPLFRATSASGEPGTSGSTVQEDLPFLVATLAPIMADADLLVPFRPSGQCVSVRLNVSQSGCKGLEHFSIRISVSRVGSLPREFLSRRKTHDGTVFSHGFLVRFLCWVLTGLETEVGLKV